jgi:predicted outer membrane repeat protein
MRSFVTVLLVLTLTAIACQSTTPTGAPAVLTPDSVSTSTPTPEVVSAPETTFTPTATTAGTIFVDTLEQEAYPFIENGKCSLGEAIFAANSAQPKDSCAAGVINESIIELMPGEYHFTQRDQTPPQVEWMVSVVDVGDALPPIIYSLTIHGNGAKLIRDESAEPFRFFELMFGTLTLKDLTLQGGDVQGDWGGAIYSMNSSISLDNVHLLNNRAENGGAIYFNLGALTVQNSEFIGNHATSGGAALFVDSSRVTIDEARFEENTSDGNGGALYAETVNLKMKKAIFIKNRVTGEEYGSRGGGIYANHVNLQITESQFYQNESPMYGGAIALNNPELAGTDEEEGDPIEQLEQNPYVSGMLTSIPGFQSTLEAHPSGIFVDFHEDAQIHDSCFANNITINPDDPNWTSGLLGRASEADGNYWGDPSGPSGMGPGRGDSVGKTLVFTPFLTEIPEYCDPILGQQQ